VSGHDGEPAITVDRLKTRGRRAAVPPSGHADHTKVWWIPGPGFPESPRSPLTRREADGDSSYS